MPSGSPDPERIKFIVGEVSEVLQGLTGSYDLIHDDAWFAAEPPYFNRMIELLRPGGTLTMPNWFGIPGILAEG